MKSNSDRWIRLLATLAVLVAVVSVVSLGVVAGDREPEAPAGWAEVFEEVAPSVLLVKVEEPASDGTAFAVSPTQVITARHLVIGATQVKLVSARGEEWTAEVVGTDARTDLALLRVDADLAPARLGSSEFLRVGDEVMTVGNPFGLGHSLANGVVSHRGRKLQSRADGPRVDFIQLSIPLNPGNSGGAVFDRDGAVIGVLAGTHRQGQGIAFAVPVEALRDGIDDLARGEHISRAFLGLEATVVDRALIVKSVVASVPADRAGIRPGDALTSVAGEVVSSPDELTGLLDDLPGGDQIAVRLLRDGQLHNADVVLGDWAEQPVAVSGMTLRPNPGSGGEVVAVRPRSRAERASVQVGDVVRTVNGLPVRSPVDVRLALSNGEPATMEIEREGMPMSAKLK